MRLRTPSVYLAAGLLTAACASTPLYAGRHYLDVEARYRSESARASGQSLQSAPRAKTRPFVFPSGLSYEVFEDGKSRVYTWGEVEERLQPHFSANDLKKCFLSSQAAEECFRSKFVERYQARTAEYESAIRKDRLASLFPVLDTSSSDCASSGVPTSAQVRAICLTADRGQSTEVLRRQLSLSDDAWSIAGAAFLYRSDIIQPYLAPLKVHSTRGEGVAAKPLNSIIVERYRRGMQVFTVVLSDDNGDRALDRLTFSLPDRLVRYLDVARHAAVGQGEMVRVSGYGLFDKLTDTPRNPKLEVVRFSSHSILKELGVAKETAYELAAVDSSTARSLNTYFASLQEVFQGLENKLTQVSKR